MVFLALKKKKNAERKEKGKCLVKWADAFGWLTDGFGFMSLQKDKRKEEKNWMHHILRNSTLRQSWVAFSFT